MTKVMVVEDDADLRGVLLRGLREEGFEATGVGSGAQLLEAFGREQPGILIVDIGLPDADGRDVLQALRAQGVQTPALFLSARDALTDRVTSFTAGGDVISYDPASTSDAAVRHVYDRAQFEKAWMTATGGIVYVIHPASVPLPPSPGGNW